MTTTCILKDKDENVIATGILLSQGERNCRIKLGEEYADTGLEAVADKIELLLTNDVFGIEVYMATIWKCVGNILHVTDMNLQNVIQRRKDVKLKMSVKLMIHPVKYCDDHGHQILVCNVANRTDITLSDISAGGLAFYSDEKLVPDQLYFLFFPYTKEPVELIFLVLRCSELEDGKYFYGCKFDNISIYAERMLRSFVYYQGLASDEKKE